MRRSDLPSAVAEAYMEEPQQPMNYYSPPDHGFTAQSDVAMSGTSQAQQHLMRLKLQEQLDYSKGRQNLTGM